MVKNIALTIALLLELVAFVSFASVSFLFPVNNALHITLFVVLMMVVITFWSAFMAPRARRRFIASKYYPAKLIIYAISAVAISGIEGLGLSVSFVAAVVIDELLLHGVLSSGSRFPA